jgi:DNA-binding transcriptional MerR regulator
MKIEKPHEAAIKGMTPKKGQLMRISEVARAAGVSTPTVRFYMKQGLLMAPAVTSRNMAYYDPRCVEEIRLIKELQAKKYLPLAVIKLIMQAEREGQEPAHLIEMREFFGKMFQPLDKEGKSRSLSFTELITVSGLPGTVLKKIETLGLLMPVGSGREKLYDDIDVNIARNIKELIDRGLTVDDMKVFSQYTKVIRDMTIALHYRVHDLHTGNDVWLADLSNTLDNLKTLLAAKVHRQVVIELHK